MYCLTNFCIVCFNYDNNLINLSNIDSDNIKLLDKLEYCSEKKIYENIPYFICSTCCYELKRAYNFKNKVLSSRNLLKMYLEHLHNNSVLNNSYCNVYISLVDIKNDESLSYYMEQKTNDFDEKSEAKNLDDCIVKQEAFDWENVTVKKEHFLLEPKVDESGEIASNDSKDLNTGAKKEVDELMVNATCEEMKNELQTETEIKQDEVNIDSKICTLNDTIEVLNTQEKMAEERLGGENSEYKKSESETDEDSEDEITVEEEVVTKSSKRVSIEEWVKVRTCHLCQKTFDCITNLKRHMLTHTGERPFSCNECPSRFARKDALNNHKQLLHTRRVGVENERPHACHICDKRFRGKNGLNYHLQMHLDTDYKLKKFNKIYTCNVCFRDFNHTGSLKRHMLLHTGEKPFVCSMCPKQFLYNYSLRSHMRTHTGEMPFSCDICGKGLSSKRSLTYHMLKTHKTSDAKLNDSTISTGASPQERTEPLKYLTSESTISTERLTVDSKKPTEYLSEHKITDSKEAADYLTVKPLEGSVADFREFIDKDKTCNTCGKTFTRSTDVRRHMKLHTGEKPFPCRVCSKRFTNKRNMLKHHMKHGTKEKMIESVRMPLTKTCEEVQNEVVVKVENKTENGIKHELIEIEKNEIVQDESVQVKEVKDEVTEERLDKFISFHI